MLRRLHTTVSLVLARRSNPTHCAQVRYSISQMQSSLKSSSGLVTVLSEFKDAVLCVVQVGAVNIEEVGLSFAISVTY